jgi:hypothetical protein
MCTKLHDVRSSDSILHIYYRNNFNFRMYDYDVLFAYTYEAYDLSI